jgi:hypothetical protein
MQDEGMSVSLLQMTAHKKWLERLSVFADRSAQLLTLLFL